MGVKTGIVVSSNWYILAIKLSAYRRWNVGKDERGTKETLFYHTYPMYVRLDIRKTPKF